MAWYSLFVLTKHQANKQTNHVSWYQNVFMLAFIRVKDDGRRGGDSGRYIRCANLQSNSYHQQTQKPDFYRSDSIPVAQPTASPLLVLPSLLVTCIHTSAGVCYTLYTRDYMRVTWLYACTVYIIHYSVIRYTHIICVYSVYYTFIHTWLYAYIVYILRYSVIRTWLYAYIVYIMHYSVIHTWLYACTLYIIRYSVICYTHMIICVYGVCYTL